MGFLLLFCCGFFLNRYRFCSSAVLLTGVPAQSGDKLIFPHIQANAAALSFTARLRSPQRGSSYTAAPPPRPEKKENNKKKENRSKLWRGIPWHGAAELRPVPGPRRGSPHCALGINALNGISLAKGRKAVGKPACVIFPSSAVAAERRRSADNRVKKKS